MQSNQFLNPQLNEIKVQIDAASRQATAIVNGVSLAQLKQRPRPDQWSIAECLVHLNLASQAEITLLNETYERTPTRQMHVERQFKMDVLSRFLKWTLEPPPMSIFKIKTTKSFQPVEVEPVDEVVPTFLSLQEQLKASVDAASGLPLDRIKVVSPFNRRIKYNLFSCFHLLLAHERRHLWQAERVKEAISQ